MSRLLAIALAAANLSTPAMTAARASAPDYRPAYIYAQRCFAVATVVKDEAGAHQAFDAAMKLGHLLNLSNRQLNEDFATWSSSEIVKTFRDPAYKEQLRDECRKLGMAD